MSTLIKQSGWYYLQFYNKSRNPVRKRVALKTRTHNTAKKKQRELEDQYSLGNYDPWTGYTGISSSIPIDDNSTVKQVLEYFIEMKSKEDWRKNTAINASYVLRAFARFVGEDKSIKEATPDQINNFLNRDQYAYETKKSHKIKIYGFANWLKKKDILKYDYSEIKIFNNDEEQDEKVSYLSSGELKILKDGIKYKVMSDIKKGYQNKDKNSLWLIDFIDWQRLSGMRLSETLNLYPSDINKETWEISIGSKKFSTKSKSKQVLPIAKVDLLKQIVIRKINDLESNNQRLFQHKSRNRTSRTFKKYIRLYLPEREDVNIHTLRHTCCIELLRAGVPIYTVQRWMRHSSINTTQKYADLLATDIASAVGKAFNDI